MKLFRSTLMMAVLLSYGCASKANSDEWAGPSRVPKEFIGKISKPEISLIEKKLKEIRFPAPEGTIAKLVPEGSKPVSAGHNIDLFRVDAKGRSGGINEIYWLNDEYVLLFATVYFGSGENTENKEMWAVVMPWKQRASYQRTPFDP
jgi:hypothetical protein